MCCWKDVSSHGVTTTDGARSQSGIVLCGSSAPENVFCLYTLQLFFYLWNFLPARFCFIHAYVCVYRQSCKEMCLCQRCAHCPVPDVASSDAFLLHSQYGCPLCQAHFSYSSTLPSVFWYCVPSHRLAWSQLSIVTTCVCVCDCMKQRLGAAYADSKRVT